MPDELRDAGERRKRLLAWYRASKRDLPWRRTRDPYAIWISEAMLQQTRVETVIEYWRRFMERFPSVHALAAAREDDVLALWSGLGYYRRARALRTAAQTIVERHAGEFPSDARVLRELPGIGPYTAGAVLSIAFDQPEALVDGNVVRVLTRWFAHDAEHAAAQRWAWDVARELVPRRGGAGDWNQALMELGATVCTPREPQCASCPVAASCAARALGRALDFPRARPRKPTVEVELVAFAVERGTSVMLERRPERGRMAGLWQLPTVQTAPAAPQLFPSRPPIAIAAGAELARARHTITHHRIRLVARRGSVSARRLPESLRWIERAELSTLALTGMTKKLLAAGVARPQASPRKHRNSVR